MKKSSPEKKSTSTKKTRNEQQINPRDYLRKVTEGTVKPTRDFIWTEDKKTKK